MRRLLRKILIAILAATALNLWLAVAVLWVRSYWRGDVIVVRSANTDQPTPPLTPRYHASTFVMLSGNGGIALATRKLSQDLKSTYWPQADERSWNTFTDPDYPKPHSSVAIATRTLKVWTTIDPSARPDTTQITIGGPTGTSFTSAQGTLSVSTSGTINVTTYVPATAPLPPTRGITSVNRTPQLPSVAGNLVLNAPGPTTMGSALANNAITPPATPPANPGQFYAYSVGTPINPDTDLGDISRMVIFPWWAVQLVVSLPMLWVTLLTRNVIRCRAWARAGCCIRCGYDLRATPQRCPECGEAVPANKVAALPSKP